MIDFKTREDRLKGFTKEDKFAKANVAFVFILLIVTFFGN